MDRTYYLNLNFQYHETRISALNNLEEIKNYLSLIEEYKKKNPKSDLSELKLSVGIDAVKKLLSIYLDDPKKKHVFIRGNNGKYLSGENGQSGMMCDRNFPLEWEKFTIEDVGNGKIALKSMNKYVSSENGQGSMTCNRWNADAWEWFEMIDNGDGTFAFKGNNGRFVSSENGRKAITCYVDANQEWEKFHLHQIHSLADEIEICWTLLNKHMIALCDGCDAAEVERSKIDPEHFYYNKIMELQHHGRGEPYASQHKERLFNADEYTAAVKSADKKIVAAQKALDKHAEFIHWILLSENKKLQEITKMFNQCSSAIAQLEYALDKKKISVASKVIVTDENDYGIVF